eukprot:gb/GECG01008154.1/.p1 GENE.gb/GECG01008154.1/~~gb/GECG01008154.1/.p1  ORF type:complete len:212 (+),score=19.99 gb/GECG01008154.1/:1-636(+)
MKSVNPLVATAGTEPAARVGQEGSIIHDPGIDHRTKLSAEVEFVDLVNSSPESSTVKVTSVKAPRVESASGKESSSPSKQVAIATNIDRAELRTVDKVLLRLREWKATLLAEPPPLVEIQTKQGNVEVREETAFGGRNTDTSTFGIGNRNDKCSHFSQRDRRRHHKTEFNQRLPSAHTLYRGNALRAVASKGKMRPVNNGTRIPTNASLAS